MAMLSTIVLGIILVALPFAITLNRQKEAQNLPEPPWLSESIPFVTNAWQFMTNKGRFIARIREALKDQAIIQCRFGPAHICIIRAAAYAPADMAHFYADRSGPTSVPRISEDNGNIKPPKNRIWYESHRMHDETPIVTRPVNYFAASFQNFLWEGTRGFPRQRIGRRRGHRPILQNVDVDSGYSGILGPRIIELNTGFIEAFWKYEKVPEVLAFGLPPWLNRRAVSVRDQFGAMCRQWYEQRCVNWELVFGSQISKGLVQWAKDFEFSAEGIGGAFALFVYGLHANAIPIWKWLMFELLKDPGLFAAVKAEIAQAEIREPGSGVYFDHQVLVSLPLLQSVFTEVMRLHVGVLITRKAASYRLVKEINTTDKDGHFEETGIFNQWQNGIHFFPLRICAGCLFANAEVLLAVSMIISSDGSASERPASDDVAYANAVAAPPDRDMRVRWKRISRHI
ncbi:putative cytochrome P450 [Xylaria sp. CBS 124048]|nr:putative cytochrome P450 [Xylaria sp. CBS 124048]